MLKFIINQYTIDRFKYEGKLKKLKQDLKKNKDKYYSLNEKKIYVLILDVNTGVTGLTAGITQSAT